MDSTLPDRIAFLGGYFPRLCGIATFTHDLCEAVAAAAPASRCYAGAVNDRATTVVSVSLDDLLAALGA
jgi:hypothetical protein